MQPSEIQHSTSMCACGVPAAGQRAANLFAAERSPDCARSSDPGRSPRCKVYWHSLLLFHPSLDIQLTNRNHKFKPHAAPKMFPRMLPVGLQTKTISACMQSAWQRHRKEQYVHSCMPRTTMIIAVTGWTSINSAMSTMPAAQNLRFVMVLAGPTSVCGRDKTGKK
jgi:hypothetical protein